MATDEIGATTFPLERIFRCHSRREIGLGLVSIEIRTNEADFKGFRFFSAPAGELDSGSQGAPHFTLNLRNLNIDAPWPVERLASMHDRSYRGRRLGCRLLPYR